VWERQWVLNQKRDAYANLLNALSRLTAILIEVSTDPRSTRVYMNIGDASKIRFMTHSRN